MHRIAPLDSGPRSRTADAAHHRACAGRGRTRRQGTALRR